MIAVISFFLVIGAVLNCGTAWKLPHNFGRHIRTGLIITTFSNSISPAFANDALEAATRAMTTAPKERVVKEKNFDELSKGGKKRKAMGLCKNDVVRKAAGYPSAAACTSAVMAGNYAITLSENFTESKLTKISSTPARPSASSSAIEVEIDKSKLTKKVDLSSLPTASQKRRALAGCKKPEVRKFAKLGSERRCTDSVLQGNFGEVIEALEYTGL